MLRHDVPGWLQTIPRDRGVYFLDPFCVCCDLFFQLLIHNEQNGNNSYTQRQQDDVDRGVERPRFQIIPYQYTGRHVSVQQMRLRSV